MSTVLITHAACLEHDTGEYHPECAERLRLLLKSLEAEEFAALARVEAPRATVVQLMRAHDSDYVDFVRDQIPGPGDYGHLDPDTVVSDGSWEAALRSAGSGIAAVDAVMAGQHRNAFCATRPPGHHAEGNAAMGFCLFNNAAIAAMHAQGAHGLKRVAVFDIDVHHGNGTQDIFYSHPGLMYLSIHEEDSFPGTGLEEESGVADNIFNILLPPGAGSSSWRQAVEDRIAPRLRAFRPELLVISAGFDAHADDPMAHLKLKTDDFLWAGQQMRALADELCGGRLVSMLEGGYDIKSLCHSASAYLRGQMGA